MNSLKWHEFHGEWLGLSWSILMIFWCRNALGNPSKTLFARLCLAMTTCRESGLVEPDMESARFGWPVGECPLFLTRKTSNWAALDSEETFVWLHRNGLSLVSRDKRAVITYHWVLIFSISTANEVCSWFFGASTVQNEIFKDGSDFQKLSRSSRFSPDCSRNCKLWWKHKVMIECQYSNPRSWTLDVHHNYSYVMI